MQYTVLVILKSVGDSFPELLIFWMLAHSCLHCRQLIAILLGYNSLQHLAEVYEVSVTLFELLHNYGHPM